MPERMRWNNFRVNHRRLDADALYHEELRAWVSHLRSREISFAAFVLRYEDETGGVNTEALYIVQNNTAFVVGWSGRLYKLRASNIWDVDRWAEGRHKLIFGR